MHSFINYQNIFNIYKSLFDFNHDACYALDLNGNFILLNDAAGKLIGNTNEEVQKSFIPLIHEDRLEETLYAFKRVLQGNREEFRTAINDRAGNRKELSVTAVPIYIDHKINGVVGIAKDVTEKTNLATLLNGQNKVLEMIAKGSPCSDVLDNIIYVVEKVSNGGVCSIHLIDEAGQKLLRGSSPNLPAEYNEFINGIPIGPSIGSCGTAAYYKRRVIVKDIASDPLWNEYRGIALKHGLRACWSSPVLDNQQNVLGVFAMYYNKPCTPESWDKKIIEKATYLTSLVIQHYHAEEKINYMAFHDALTGLPNRRLFDERVNLAITNFEHTQDKMLGLMFLDLDRFKIINDSLGHNIGDLLLRDVAERLQTCLGDKDTPSRQGGDEFTILIETASRREIEKIAQNILDEVGRPYMTGGHEIFVTPSIGISLYPFDGEKASSLLRKADLAMYQAKKEGRNNFQFYDEKLAKKTFDRLELENELRKALAKDEFSLHYQPIINLSNNRITSVESLIRWNNEKLGMVMPKQFIPIAEETGMIIDIGEWVIRTACYQLKRWEEDGIQSLTISVNISIRQFYQPNLITMISNILKEAEIDPQNLTIEITESMTMDVETATFILCKLKTLGVNISIDDFGTGYSSLSYLKKFPIDYLKIDQSFICDITNSKNDESIATTILLMAKSLDLSVIAEGVETAEQLEILRRHYCQEAQGYLLGKPLPPLELEPFLKSLPAGSES
ncbi:bifunctional diguanylate cyclase/phosphodiesterase [Mesobacillus harenae]|uniref:bifunctional diguanylate cyclase/phosphodiesterase n=1 Tax=Mesobacillus harenae TaxID=2213203 RepID=UPI0015812445|nr:EAL domain-containing protein [Mesobacillus harenae]